jgi:hypothetical protein
MGAPELPVIYENPRFDQFTPTFKPVLDRVIRFSAVMAIEWSTLGIMEDSPRYLKWATVIIAASILAVHESWPWLRLRGRLWYPIPMTALLISWLSVAGYAFTHFPPEPRLVAPSAPAAQPKAVDTRRNPLDSEEAKWKLVKGLHDRFTVNKVARCQITIMRYQLPYAENLSNDLKTVFGVIDWPVKEQFAAVQEERGLSIRFVPEHAGNKTSQNCASEIINSLVSAASWKGNLWRIEQIYYAEPPSCADCIEIDIGNDPDAP